MQAREEDEYLKLLAEQQAEEESLKLTHRNNPKVLAICKKNSKRIKLLKEH